MGKALEIVTGLTTAAGAAGAAITALTGNSLTVRNGHQRPICVAAWRTGQAVGHVRITSPYLHDAVVGIDCMLPSGSMLLFAGGEIPLYPQDQLVVVNGGSATAGDIEHVSMLIYYPDLPGVEANLITAGEYEKRKIDFLAQRNTITTTATGQYTGTETVIAEEDAFKAKTDYALLGCTLQTGAHAVAWAGPDFGNLRLGMPAIAAYLNNATFFLELARATGLPLIPVINSANKSLTNIDAVQNENAAAVVMSSVYGRLK